MSDMFPNPFEDGPSTQNPPDLLLEVAAAMGFVRGDSEYLFGRTGGYPVAVTSIGDGEQLDLLFQIRHHLREESLPDESTFDWDGVLEGLVAADGAKVEVEERIAWLSLYRVPSQPGSATLVVELLRKVLDELDRGGIGPIGDTCHKCLEHTVDHVTFDEGRVGQVCQNCLDHVSHARSVEKEASAIGVASSVMVGMTGSVVGAIAWAGCWIAHDWIVGLLSRGKDSVFLPGIVLIAETVIIGLLTGGVVGYAISRVPKRGDHVAGLIGALGGLGAVVLGEILFSIWLVYSLENVVTPLAPLTIPGYWIAGGIDSVLRGMAAILSVALAWGIARPKLTPMDL